LQKTLLAGLILMAAAVFCGSAAATQADADVSEYRSALVQLVDTMAEILYTIDPDSIDTLANVVTQVEDISDEDLETVYMEHLPLKQLQQQIQILEPHLMSLRGLDQTARGLDQTQVIEPPSEEVRPPVCKDASPEYALVLSATAAAAELLLAELEYVCFQQDGGFNAGLACTAVEVFSSLANHAYELESFCLGETRTATADNSIELSKGIGEHLNEFVDEVALSTRATQDALDAAQDDIDTIGANTQSVQGALDSGYSQLNSQAGLLMQAATDLGIKLNQLAAMLDDINFRSAVNLAELQDLGERVADLQQRARLIQEDVETIKALVSDVGSSVAQLKGLLESDWSRQQRDRIAADLGNTLANSPGHALPSSAGGELELAREIVIAAISSLKALGTVDTSKASDLLKMADTSYNAGQYPDAYLLLKRAYQTLDGLSEAR